MRTIRRLDATLSLCALAALAACDAGGKNADVSAAGPQLHITSPRMDHTFADAEQGRGPLRPARLRDRARRGGEERAAHPPDPGQHALRGDLRRLEADPAPRLLEEGRGEEDPCALRGHPRHPRVPLRGPARQAGDAPPRVVEEPRGLRLGAIQHRQGRGRPSRDSTRRSRRSPTAAPRGTTRSAAPARAVPRRLLAHRHEARARGNAVRATLDGKQILDKESGQPVLFTAWQRQIIPSPAVGEHEMLLELVDRDGKLVEGPFNSTTRKFKVAE